MPKVTIFETKKWHFEWPNQNSKTTFIVQTFPKYVPYDLNFMNLLLLGAILAMFQFCWFSGFFCQFSLVIKGKYVIHVCSKSRKTNFPIIISKKFLKSVLWRGLESTPTFCIFQLLCFSLHPIAQAKTCFWLTVFFRWGKHTDFLDGHLRFIS